MSTMPATRAPNPLVALRERLYARQGELRAALPPDIRPEEFIRAALTSAQLNPDIVATSWSSFWTACLRACRDGLLPDNTEGAIVAFGSNAQWLPMYRGLLKKFQQSGQFKDLSTHIVREGEEFSHWIDEDGEHFRHVPGDGTGKIVKVYARASTKDGGKFLEIVTMSDATKIRNMSRTTRGDSPWAKWEPEMLRKTALRRLSKYLPSSPADDLIRREDEDEHAPPVAAASPVAVIEDESPAESPTTNQETIVNESAPAPAAVVMDDLLLIAREAGADARAQGVPKKRPPGEYRDDNRKAEREAWERGWDAADAAASGGLV